MKQLFVILSMMLLISCAERAEEKQISLEGRFVTASQGEFSKMWDTVIIKAIDPKIETYLIEHHTSFQRVRQGVVQPKAFKEERLVGVFDPSHDQLLEQKKGRVYRFSSSGSELVLGSERYQRVH